MRLAGDQRRADHPRLLAELGRDDPDVARRGQRAAAQLLARRLEQQLARRHHPAADDDQLRVAASSRSPARPAPRRSPTSPSARIADAVAGAAPAP